MNKNLLFLILTILFSPVYSQIKINGKVANSDTKEPLAYVNIGIPGKNVGTVSDNSGKFSLSINQKNENDTLVFSMLGYEMKKVLIQKIIGENDIQIKLKETAFKLDEVIIDATKLKPRNTGVKAKKDWTNSGFTSNELGNEIGTRIQIKQTPAIIEQVKFRIAYNKYDTVFLRMNIYEVVDDMPASNLLDQNVFVSTTTKNGDVIVDLSKFNITTTTDVIVTLELVKHLGKGGLMFTSRKLSKGGLYFRHTSQADWKKYGDFTIAMNVTTLVEK